MKEITLKIPEDRLSFFKDLMMQLGFEISNDFIEIPEEHKAIVRQRSKMSKENPDILLNWDDVKDSFK